MSSSGMERYLPRLSEDARRWARFGGLLVAALLIVLAARALQQVLTPIAVALAIAYILNPLVNYLESRCRIARVFSAAAGVLLIVLGVGLIGAIATAQLLRLIDNIPQYAENLHTWTDTSLPWLRELLADSERLRNLLQQYGPQVGTRLAGSLGAFLGNAMYVLTLAALLPMYIFFFVVEFNRIKSTIHGLLPAAYRPTLVRIWVTIDRAVSNFFRGRVVVCACVGALSGIGWLIVGVPYNLALGVLAGLLNLVPFMSILALPPVFLLTYLQSADAGAPWLWPVVFAMGVHLLVQAIESFLLSPLIESRAAGLHPVTTVVALLIGAQVAGLLGMLLVIPLASTLKSLGIEYALPELRRLAAAAPAEAPAAARTPEKPQPPVAPAPAEKL